MSGIVLGNGDLQINSLSQPKEFNWRDKQYYTVSEY